MGLFDTNRASEAEKILGSDVATRALSAADVEHEFVADVYAKMSAVYDYTFGPVSHPGRVEAIRRMGIRPGDRVLEVGVGTGINASLYPRGCSVTGIDFSPKMLQKAEQRIERNGVRNVRLLEMDATNLRFADDSFDIVYAPYVISVVPDPIAVTKEMWRVCRHGGRVIILNHFRSESRLGSWLEHMIAPFTPYLGFKSDLDRPAFIAQANLTPLSIERVNGIWSLITCNKK
jgi:phosphatidylethanolamine/phosphatidyl-N-methylethanolamine N-methyltransferase